VTLEILGGHEDARRAGITALIGMGSLAGVTNLMARYAADHLLDEVEAVDIFHAHGGEPWKRRGDRPPPPLACPSTSPCSWTAKSDCVLFPGRRPRASPGGGLLPPGREDPGLPLPPSGAVDHPPAHPDTEGHEHKGTVLP